MSLWQLAQGSFFGEAVHGELGAVGISVLVGAFLFGLGMQLGGGCASGTLYTAGGGNTRMLATLAAFIAGSALGAYHFAWWENTPNLGRISLIDTLGWIPALLVSLALFGAVALVTIVLERRRHGALKSGNAAPTHGWRRMLQGPWPLAWGAIALAIGNFLTLVLAAVLSPYAEVTQPPGRRHWLLELVAPARAPRAILASAGGNGPVPSRAN